MMHFIRYSVGNWRRILVRKNYEIWRPVYDCACHITLSCTVVHAPTAYPSLQTSYQSTPALLSKVHIALLGSESLLASGSLTLGYQCFFCSGGEFCAFKIVLLAPLARTVIICFPNKTLSSRSSSSQLPHSNACYEARPAERVMILFAAVENSRMI